MKYKINVATDPAIETIYIKEGLENGNSLIRDMVDDFHWKIFNTREQAIREALIQLGWTPPKEERDE